MRLQPVLWIAPLAIFMILFAIFPLFFGVSISLTNRSLIYPDTRIVWFSNFLRLVKDTRFWYDFSTSCLFVFSTMIFQFLVGFGLALLLSQNLRGTVVFRSTALLAWAAPGVVVGLVWQWMLWGDRLGLINYVLSLMNIPSVKWLANRGTAMVSLIIANAWKGVAFSMMIEYAAIQTIPLEIHDAASVDGVRGVQKVRYIVLPLIRTPVLVNFIILSIQTFDVIDIVMALTGGGPAGTTEVLTVYIYNQAFSAYDLGYASSISVFMLIMNACLVLLYMNIAGSFRKE